MGAAEETRVLYVALTRARDRLIVIAGAGKGRSRWVEALEPWGYSATNAVISAFRSACPSPFSSIT